MGRIAPSKGTHLAIDVAEKCGLELLIAGNSSSEKGGLEYFQTHVAPRLSDRVRWIGDIGDAEKSQICGGALALLFRITGPEAFGLVMVEAMLSGTPVIAFNCESVPEIVENGKTGFTVTTVEEMAVAVGRVGQISRATCARIARERFDGAVMVDRYIEIYRELMTDAGERRSLQLVLSNHR